MNTSAGSIAALLNFLSDLDDRCLQFRLQRSRPEAILVLVNVPGERWEVEFFPDGHCEVERFKSNGEILGEEALPELFDFGESPAE